MIERKIDSTRIIFNVEAVIDQASRKSLSNSIEEYETIRIEERKTISKHDKNDQIRKEI